MLINHFERMERLVSHIFFNVWYNWCINTVTLKIQGGARAPPCPNLPKPMSGPVIYSTTLRANELDDIPTIRLDLRVPVKKYYYPVRNLTTIDGFSTTPAIEPYSSRAPTETSGLSFMELSLS